MLTFSRKVGETIRISDDITVTVVDIRGRQVRIKVEAPRDVPVHRGEVYDEIQAETA